MSGALLDVQARDAAVRRRVRGAVRDAAAASGWASVPAATASGGAGGLDMTERERELGAIISAYLEVTERLKVSHERLNEEVRQLREELHGKNEALRRSERLAALGEMAAGLAHEIRNPLGGIALYASMLEGQLTDRPPAQAAAGKISNGVRSLNALVSEILDFAQEERIEPRTCRFGGILAEACEAVRPWAEQEGAEVRIDRAAYDAALHCDPERMRRVIVNLLLNGVQAAGRGGAVTLSLCTGADGTAEIEISDDGPGIPADQLSRVFNPFFTTRPRGTGLGLAIAHRIVEAHGGAIDAGNRAEGGARFVIRLPAAALPSATAA